ncbi:hypothetical protein LR48_Vigan404s002200 [Vigna angularis]|uniref:CCHC-type domain-containing protein n=1 Tax=Phaseolus angularis TaxID=3914 RepID=A0A0L9T9X5_PHAAN|nr:hypothetical protein LR48_Vigan404s002200 [Vigna angularis]
MASSVCFEDNDSDFENEPIEVKYYMLLDTYQELHAEAMKLQYKVNRLNSERRDFEYRINSLVDENEKLKNELETTLQSANSVKTKIPIVEKECQNCNAHIEKIEYLTSTLSKFTLGRDNLEAVLTSQGRAINRQGICYKAKSNRINSKKFIDLSKPVTNACFYCDSIGHTVRNCYYRKVGVPRGKYKWIPKEQPPVTNKKRPQVYLGTCNETIRLCREVNCHKGRQVLKDEVQWNISKFLSNSMG